MTRTNIQNAFPKGQPSQRLNKEFIGMSAYFDPTVTQLSDVWVREQGVLLSRTEYAEFWAWVQATHDSSGLVTDAEWLALQTSSPNGAVSVYSTGDGATNFRIPTTGNGVFFRDKGAITDPVLLSVGQQDQIVNITGFINLRPSSYQGDKASTLINGGGALQRTTVAAGGNVAVNDLINPNSVTEYEQIILDASRQVRTGSEVQPNNAYKVSYIYTGKLDVSYSPLPDVYDELEALKREIDQSKQVYEHSFTDSGATVVLRRMGNTVDVFVSGTFSQSGDTNIGNVVPEGYRPQGTIIALSGGQNSTYQVYQKRIQIGAGGSFTFAGNASTAVPYLVSASYTTIDPYPTDE